MCCKQKYYRRPMLFSARTEKSTEIVRILNDEIYLDETCFGGLVFVTERRGEFFCTFPLIFRRTKKILHANYVNIRPLNTSF